MSAKLDGYLFINPFGVVS